MYPIHPISQDTVKPLYGQLVCVMMKDGTRHVGVLSLLHKGRLILNDDSNEQLGPVEKEPKQKKKKGNKIHKKSLTTSSLPDAHINYYPYNPYYGFRERLVLDIALIGFLFLLL